jgi:hypothetical protein
MKWKSITKWKKTDFKIFFDCSRELREKSHLSNVTSQRNHLSCLVCHWIKKKHSLNNEISIETTTKRSIVESNNSSTKKQVLKLNSIIIFISTQIFQSSITSFSSSITEINTSFSDSASTISLILNSLKRYFELRYRLDFSDSLNLLVMKCMQNVTNS